MRRAPLRARLTLLTALAVAAAIAVSAAACWFLVRGQLNHQLDESLTGRRAGPPPPHLCEEPPPDARLRPFLFVQQVVWADGRTCTAPGERAVRVTPADLAVAAGRSRETLRDGVAADGTEMRVFTRPAGPGVALLTARSRTELEDSLRGLALLLAGVAAVGVLGAATAGLLIARAALAPVDRLTGAVEHIARTEDLDTRIPAEGDDEIARLGRAFNTMTAALAASRERQQRLIADAGHELRTPLTSLRANVDLLLRSDETGRPLPDRDRRRLLDDVRAQLRELSSLVVDLLELSRPARGPDPAVPYEVIRLDEVAERAVRRVRPRRQDVRLDVELEPYRVRGDAAALERAVVNLLDNAIKFSPPGGTVAVRLRGGELTVRDRGGGIADEDLPYVFDRFWRSPAARGLPGSGLGLAIVARAVRESGGEVTLEPAPGGGTTARLTLPGAPPGE
ncbi:HAMP domain-containing sensor histidine kinase [Bailinhaonella thermotolerans]|uniref:histidine kinase n=1 Tax=Bailinhaonella thermotolerans TaxID=1070861 RepID=A0A3A4ACR7_9ACTN|nr:HAMP domain-containing sensor histidine kinase [Bailinhaonella thermotolerans]RJL26455.1 sensor histidine kinase [Bailinhaonella thermotolerans]